MSAPPGTSPVPPPIFMPQTSPTPSPLPHRQVDVKNAEKSSSNVDPKQKPSDPFPLPKLRLEIYDLTHPGAIAFLSSVVPTTAIEFAVRRSLDLLYLTPNWPTTTVPSTRSITLILRSMPGVAYTTGKDLDNDHKEIHFSVEYINGIQQSRKADEILGVLTHEVVHCYQYNAYGTCPGGLIEGIADWVRLNSNLSPPHWKRDASGKWDAGYQHTGYFLDYLEKRFGNGTISRMNEKLRTDRYEENQFWTELLGRQVEQLWGDYAKAVTAENELWKAVGTSVGDDDDEMVMVEKEDALRSEKQGMAQNPPNAPIPTVTQKHGNEGASDGTAKDSIPAGVV